MKYLQTLIKADEIRLDKKQKKIITFSFITLAAIELSLYLLTFL